MAVVREARSPGWSSPKWRAFQDEERNSFELCMHLTVVEELFDAKPAISTGRMKRSVWRQMPVDLMDRVLLFVPASSQARFQVVCKRWREVICSSEFRKESAFIAFCSSDTVCICSPEEPCDIYDKSLGNSIKVYKYSLSFLPVELRQHDNLGQFFTHGGLLGMAAQTTEGIRLCVFNPGNRTWRELPPVVYDLEPDEWPHMSMVAYKHKGFKVFMAWTHRLPRDGGAQVYTRFRMYSSDTNAWVSSVFTLSDPRAPDVPDDIWPPDYVVSGREFIHVRDSGKGKVLRMTWDGLHWKTLGCPPEGNQCLETQVCHLGASYYEETLFWVRNTCSIFQCRMPSKSWKLVSRPPKALRDDMNCPRSSKCELISAQVVGHLILVVCACPDNNGLVGKYILAYHILEESWKLVVRVSYFWECHWFLSSRPELLVA